MEFIFGLQYYNEKKKVCLAVTGFCGLAFNWWHRVAQTRRFNRMPQITSWSEMKAIMKKMFVAEIYGQSDLEELNSPFSSAWSRSRSARDEQKVCHGHGDQRKTQQFGYLHSQQFQDVNRQEIQQQQAVNALEQDQQRRLDRDILKPPAIPSPEGDRQVDEKFGSWSTQQILNKNKKQTSPNPISKPAAKDRESAPEPVTPCQGDYMETHLKQEEISSVICDLVPVQNQSE